MAAPQQTGLGGRELDSSGVIRSKNKSLSDVLKVGKGMGCLNLSAR